MTQRSRWAVGPGELTGAVADLGIFVPLAGSLVLVNGLSGGMVLVVAGALLIASGARFGIPWPVQPLKALTAVAVARELPAEVITAAGLLIGVVLLAVSVGATAQRLARLFTVTVIRALQLGVGLLLMTTAVRLAIDPPAVFAEPLPSAWGWSWTLPAFPSLQAFGTAAVLLVLPQLPLTFGNAVVAVTDIAHRAFGDRAAAVTPAAVSRSAGIGNVVSAVVGGMPMCHGSSGLTAHYRMGARTAGMGLVLGAVFITVGLVFGDQSVLLLAQLPPLVLAGLLAYAGACHAWLVADRRGRQLALAVAAGVLGAATGNLLATLVVAGVGERALSRPWPRPPADPPRPRRRPRSSPAPRPSPPPAPPRRAAR